MEGTAVCLQEPGDADAHHDQHVLLISLMAVLKCSCTCMALHAHFLGLLSQVSTVQAEHQGSSAARPTGSASHVPAIYAVLISHEERSHTPLWSFLVHSAIYLIKGFCQKW